MLGVCAASPEQAVEQRDVLEVKVGDGNIGVGLARAFGGEQEAAAGGAAAGLVLLLRAHPHRPPHGVAAVDVLVGDVVDYAPAAAARVGLDVYALERRVEAHVHELAVAHL